MVLISSAPTVGSSTRLGWSLKTCSLVYSCMKQQRDAWLMNERQADLEKTNAVIEVQIAKRTAELKTSSP